MIGQKNLIKKLNLYNIDTFPRSVIFIGEQGMGKHTLIDYLKENIIKLPAIDISENICDEYLDSIYRCPNPFIYIIDLSKLDEKKQNMILKFTEEPLNNSFIIILSESRNIIINTLLNRCMIFDLEPYSRDELELFVQPGMDKELTLTFLKSPGKIKTVSSTSIPEMCDLSKKIIEKLAIASYTNTLSIADKMNFSDNYDKFDFDVFLDVLGKSLFNSFIVDGNDISLKMYHMLIDYRKILSDKRINRLLSFENFLSQLWIFARSVKV